MLRALTRAHTVSLWSKGRSGELIFAGETGGVEFKQTARVNLSTNQRDQVIELMVVKSVAGFMNAHGGTLLLGVTTLERYMESSRT